MLETLMVSPTKPEEAAGAVIMLHGYGDEGKSYIEMAAAFEQMLPEHLYDKLYWLAPDAPLALIEAEGQPAFGHAWFPLEFAPDGSKFDYKADDYNRTREILVDYLASVSKELDVPFENIILMGFSQGAMLTLHTAPQLDSKLAGAIALAGRILDPKTLETAKQRPSFLLMHGDIDDVVDHSGSVQAEESLKTNGFDVYFESVEGAAHTTLFTPETLMTISNFISQRLG